MLNMLNLNTLCMMIDTMESDETIGSCKTCCKKKKIKNKLPSCTFRLWASWMTKDKTFQIKSLVSEHNCSWVFKFGSIVAYKWLGKQFMSEIIEKPKMSVRKMKAKVSTTFNINVSVGQCRNSKKFALLEIGRSLIEHYGRLCSYGHGILRTNLGSIVRNANNHIYFITWVVVGVENKANWKWFIDLLMDDIYGGLGAGITLLSNGHKGLLEVVEEMCLEAKHRQCARTIVANFTKRFTRQNFRKLFWRVVNASTEKKFKRVMEQIKYVDTRAYDYHIDRDPNTWYKAYFQEGRDFYAIENGVIENFNSTIRHARRKPIITILKEIRIFVMERICSQRFEGIEWDLCWIRCLSP
uniref:Uncharacterized protein n=1 Tax=Lactuca sativa TaxID=4236 RepID=A0A9R1W1K3_LACSA|nr:hypothetical protein LSAT_V11C300131620 [Lactuca sativa]